MVVVCVVCALLFASSSFFASDGLRVSSAWATRGPAAAALEVGGEDANEPVEEDVDAGGAARLILDALELPLFSAVAIAVAAVEFTNCVERTTCCSACRASARCPGGNVAMAVGAFWFPLEPLEPPP